MRELKVTNIKGKLKIESIKVYDLYADPENEVEFEIRDKSSVDDELAVDRAEFFRILDKASQPIKRETKSDSE